MVDGSNSAVYETWATSSGKTRGVMRFGAQNPSHSWWVIAGTIYQALVDCRRQGLRDRVPRMRGLVAEPIGSDYMFNQTVIPPHPGAAAYARERGYIRPAD